MNETIVVENGQAAVATTSVSGTLSPASSATDTIAIVDTPAGKQAALKVYNLNSGGGGASGDFLPLTGGTLTGLLTLNAAKTATASYSGEFLRINVETEDGKTKLTKSLSMSPSGKIDWAGLNMSSVGNILPNFSTGVIGSKYDKWATVYTTKLNNGADLAVPTTGGTIARIEDIDSVVGDISTALTAILGE